LLPEVWDKPRGGDIIIIYGHFATLKSEIVLVLPFFRIFFAQFILIGLDFVPKSG